MSELDEMREKIAQFLFGFLEQTGMEDLRPFAESKQWYIEDVENLLNLQTKTCRIAVVRKEAELPETLIDELEYGDQTCCDFRWGVHCAQQDMLKAGYVQEIHGE